MLRRRHPYISRRWATSLIAVALWSGTRAIPVVADVLCGNGHVDSGEECDDGGICIGGVNAGTRCTSESQCLGDGVCVGGTHAGTTCAADVACAGGACIRCNPFGGDGCAANCTLETDVRFVLVPGQIESTGIDLKPQTSGITIHSDPLTIAKPLTGAQTLTIGKARNGMIPAVIRASTVHFDPSYSGPGGGCACVRGVTRRTCGGTLLEADGVTPSLDCTAGFTLGDQVCDGVRPCASLHGPGNSAAGAIGCDASIPDSITVTQDSGGTGPAAPAVLLPQGNGGSGAAALLATTATAIVVGQCTGTDAVYGLDQAFCTSDDPQAARGTPLTVPFVTGEATAQLFNANGASAATLGPYSVNGAPFRCDALAKADAGGACLAAASTSVDQPTFGDTIYTSALCAEAGVATPTPTPLPHSACDGDCNDDRQVTVDELIMGINIVLGSASIGACPNFSFGCCAGVQGDACITIVCAFQGINNALYGCPP